MQTVNELIAELSALSAERRMQPVMISVRHDDRDEWPRQATRLTIEDIGGEPTPEDPMTPVVFLGITGFADDWQDPMSGFTSERRAGGEVEHGD